jgi:hypothetical protein
VSENSGSTAKPKTASRHDKSDTSCLGVLSGDGHVHTPVRRKWSTRLSVLSLQHFLWRHPRLHESWSEIRNCHRRIRLLYRRGRGSFVSTGRMFLAIDSQALRPNTTSQARRQSIEKLLSARPWASLQDQQLFLCGWEMGREWSLGNLGVPGEEPIGYSYASDSLLAELGGNSMPPSAVPQPPKRDPSSPLPS